MRILRYSVGISALIVFGGVIFAYAQMTPYVPPTTGTGTGGAMVYPTGGGSTGGSTGTAGTTSTGTSGGSAGTTTPTDPYGVGSGSSAPTAPSSSGTSGTGTTGTGGGYTASPTQTNQSASQESQEYGEDYSWFNDWADYGYAVDFQDQLEVIAKKPKKPKKTFLGISVFGKADIQRLPFTGSAIGSNWRIGGTANDPVAQGTLTGKGSRTAVRVGLYTGSVYAQFDGAKSNWVANYYSEGGAQRSDLYNGRFGIYQEEAAVDDEGNSRKLALLLNEQTLFGAYEGGTFFVVDNGALPDAAPAQWAGISIPRGAGPLIPTQKIIELLTKAGIALRDMFVGVAHATLKSLTPAQVFDRLAAYKKIVNAMQGIQQKFAAFDFNDPNLDYDAVQELVDAYDVEQQKLDYLVTQLGRARLFVRGGDWLMMGGSAAGNLIAQGVAVVPATLVSQISGSFDFYAIEENDGKKALFAGTCTGRNNPTTGEEITCALRKPSPTEEKSVMAAHDAYLALTAQAHEALGSIESALFAPAE